MNKPPLSFQKGNAKLGPSVHTFSLPAGHTCPGAKDCLSTADRRTGRISDGPDTLFRCFAATAEAGRTSVRKSRWANFESLRKAKTRENMASIITTSMPPKASMIRIHVSGDFFNQDYFLAWTDAARGFPHIQFYAYTKSIHLWRKFQEFVPDNLRLTASLGGKFDASAHGLKTATVVFDEAEAEALGLEIDHDDSHAQTGPGSFALLLHGTQPKGTEASAALSKLRAAGKGGYSRKRSALVGA